MLWKESRISSASAFSYGPAILSTAAARCTPCYRRNTSRGAALLEEEAVRLRNCTGRADLKQGRVLVGLRGAASGVVAALETSRRSSGDHGGSEAVGGYGGSGALAGHSGSKNKRGLVEGWSGLVEGRSGVVEGQSGLEEATANPYAVHVTSAQLGDYWVELFLVKQDELPHNLSRSLTNPNIVVTEDKHTGLNSLPLRAQGNFTYGRFTTHNKDKICWLDIKIDIEYLAILYPQYTDEAMTLVHTNGPSVTPKKTDDQFLLHCQYKRWRHSGRLALAYVNKSGQTLSVSSSCM
ncbi:hypothetical protein DPX16_17545 [Anabarilius grahami]|uniref:Uncharacterized protein n=1 Tax=Anabarilius grahami TaxID=495550 RepID=A0A3N0Y0B3_ANAGA|nr:hypothetical protein DPX16_17545 [Anabarilius grahami]